MHGQRRFWTGLFAAVLLLGAFDWHLAGEPPEALVPRAGEIYFPGASHPDQPAHLEAAIPAQRPVCPTCLHNLQTSGGHLRAVRAVAPSTLATSALPDLVPLTAGGSHRPSPARGPPSIS